MTNLAVNPEIAHLLFKQLKSRISDKYCMTRYRQRTHDRHTLLSHDLDSNLTCAAAVLLQSVLHKDVEGLTDKIWNLNTNSVDESCLRILFHNCIKSWCSSYHASDDVRAYQRQLFFQYYVDHEKSKNKFSAGGFLAYHLIKFCYPNIVSLLKADDLDKASTFLPKPNTGLGGVAHGFLGADFFALKFYGECFENIFHDIFSNILMLNNFCNYLDEVIGKCSDAHDEETITSAFFEYKDIPGLASVFRREITTEYLIGIFCKPTWCSQRIKSMISDLERRSFLNPSNNGSEPACHMMVDVPKLTQFVSSLMLLKA